MGCAVIKALPRECDVGQATARVSGPRIGDSSCPLPVRRCVQIRTKRIYERPVKSDGRRILIDRLWPRGVARPDAQIHYWAKAVAPSHELRRWYQHDPAKWQEFRKRYFAELDANSAGLAELRPELGRGTVTLVFSSRETHLNNATALKEYLESRS